MKRCESNEPIGEVNEEEKKKKKSKWTSVKTPRHQRAAEARRERRD